LPAQGKRLIENLARLFGLPLERERLAQEMPGLRRPPLELAVCRRGTLQRRTRYVSRRRSVCTGQANLGLFAQRLDGKES
jgi:hypothetical protein